MSLDRDNPDQILKRLKVFESQKKIGKLTFFLGYAAGVGKTYAMLKEAHRMKESGEDVVVGYIEPHARPETTALLEGLEIVAPKMQIYKGIQQHDIDMVAILQRKPKLVLIDELAHTNIDTAQHMKRYQDVQELLKSGIDVYTTMNIQHIESLNDIVASVTGIHVQERVPDYVFDEAYQVKIIDIEPQLLLERLAQGKIYRTDQANKAMQHFFNINNLIALREITLRRVADRLNRETQQQKKSNPGEHILVCLSSSPSNAKIIRTAARLAQAFNATFTALFVETPKFEDWGPSNKGRLLKNSRLAEQLGANIEKVYGDHVPQQIAEFANRTRVTKIVLGSSNTKHRWLRFKKTFTEELTAFAPNIDIHIIPDHAVPSYKSQRSKWSNWSIKPTDFLFCLLILVAITGIGFLVESFDFNKIIVVHLYLIGVLIAAIFTANQTISILMASASIFFFNFFFVSPIFSFDTSNQNYQITFITMFLTAFLIGNLASRLKTQARNAVEAASTTSWLLKTNHLLQQATTKEDIIEITAQQLVKFLNVSIVTYMEDSNHLSPPKVFLSNDGATTHSLIHENEKAVAHWVLRNNKYAGASSNTLGKAKCFYLAIRTSHAVYGVIGISLKEGQQLNPFTKNVVLSIIDECAFALENETLLITREEALMEAKKEALRADLLRGISHDLRTPLTTIMGNISLLQQASKTLQQPQIDHIYQQINSDSQWLINLVENVLALSKVQDPNIQLHFQYEMLDDIIQTAIQHIKRHYPERTIFFETLENLSPIYVEVSLMTQVFVNLIDNAIKYSSVQDPVQIKYSTTNEWIIIDIIDQGLGILEGQREHVFKLFYTSQTPYPSEKRGLGIGLALCKSIIQVHDGSIEILSNKPVGTIFRVRLPYKEVLFS